MTSAARCVVVGGGLSGLSTAYMLSKLPSELVSRVSIYESSSDFGGFVKTVKHTQSGSFQDLGPHSVRITDSSSSLFLRLTCDLGLEKEIRWLQSPRRYIFASGGLRLMNALSWSTEPPFTRSPLTLIMKRALSRGPKSLTSDTDMSVDEFLRTRFDDEFANYIGTALIRGICAGDSRKLSVSALLPSLVKFDANGPNLFLGAVKETINGYLKSKRQILPSNMNTVLPMPTNLKIPSKTSILSLQKGMQTLTDTLVDTLKNRAPRVVIRHNTKVTNVARKGEQFQLSLLEGKHILFKEEFCDALFLCIPASVCGTLLKSRGILSPTSEAAFLLSPDSLPSASIAICALEFDSNLDLPVHGFGHLVPSSESDSILGVVYDSLAFPHLSGNNNCTRFTIMMLPPPEWLTQRTLSTPFELDESIRQQILKNATVVLQSQLGLKHVRPDREIVGIWSNCIPNYPVGHVQNVQKIRLALNDALNPGFGNTLYLVGSSFDGIGVSDCVVSAAKAVSQFQERL